MKDKIIIGTRGSALALKQTEMVKAELLKKFPDLACEVKIIKTSGDVFTDKPLHEIGGKEVFSREIDAEMLNGNIDIAVHSLKDLPATLNDKIEIVATLEREDVRDSLIGAKSISDIPQGTVFGTSAPRRRSQILALRPDLKIVEMRGNVPTRIEKHKKGEVAAMLLAVAGLKRLGLNEYVNPLNELIPAAGQGAIAITTLTGEFAEVKDISHDETFICVSAERAVLKAFGGDCFTPIAAHATLSNDEVYLRTFYGKFDGSKFLKLERAIKLDYPPYLPPIRGDRGGWNATITSIEDFGTEIGLELNKKQKVYDFANPQKI